jgi:hypothetical protein
VDDIRESKLKAVASDSDQDMLTYSWVDHSGEASLPPIPAPCVTASSYGPHTYTVTVDDGHGHTATDSVTINFTAPAGR